MLSQQDNALISQVGKGTPMGIWLRRFWTPLLLADELEADGAPKEVRMFGEDLLAFRDTQGKVGVIQALCPHRQAQLVYARNEDSGLRCIYHGWKFDVGGHCLDMPNEPAESVFKDKVRARSYPTGEAAGIIWVYMGLRPAEAQLPDMEWMRVPASHRNTARFTMDGNWVQALEGDVDSSHIGFLHSNLRGRVSNGAGGPPPPDWSEPENRWPSRPGFYGPLDGYYGSLDQSPRWVIQPANHGLMIAAHRNGGPDHYYWRINQVMLPYYTLVAGSLDQNSFFMHMWVPTDDTHTAVWTVNWRVYRPMTADERESMFSGSNAHVASYDPATHTLRGNHTNRFFQDRELQKTTTFSGILGIREQDAAMTVGMGSVVDRTEEHLGTADAAVIAVRRVLLRAAKALQNGEEPQTPYHGDWYRDRAWAGVLPRNEDFLNDPEARKMAVSTVP